MNWCSGPVCWRAKQCSALGAEPESPLCCWGHWRYPPCLTRSEWDWFGLVFFQTGCTSPHYKLLSFPPPGTGPAKWALPLVGASNSFHLRGTCVRKHWERRKGTKKGRRKAALQGSQSQTSSGGLFLTQALIRKPHLGTWSCRAAKCQRVCRRSGESLPAAPRVWCHWPPPRHRGGLFWNHPVSLGSGLFPSRKG